VRRDDDLPLDRADNRPGTNDALSSHPDAELRITAWPAWNAFTCRRHPVAPRVTWP